MMQATEAKKDAGASPRRGGFQAAVVSLVPEWVTPNHLTIIRILGSLAVIWMAFTPSVGLGWLIVVGFSAGISDNLDGMVARQRGLVTKLGALLDPVADKLYALALILALWWRGLFDWRVLMLVVAMDLHVVAIPLLIVIGRLRRGQPLRPLPWVQTNRWGKLKTAFFAWGMGLTVIAAWADWNWLRVVGAAGIWGALGLGFLALVNYFRAWWRGDFA